TKIVARGVVGGITWAFATATLETCIEPPHSSRRRPLTDTRGEDRTFQIIGRSERSGYATPDFVVALCGNGAPPCGQRDGGEEPIIPGRAQGHRERRERRGSRRR